MISFEWPFLFFLLPLPYLVYLFFPSSEGGKESALRVPTLKEFQVAAAKKTHALSYFQWAFALLFWGFLVGAAARPQWVGEQVQIPQNGRDLMLGVDLSGSMQIQDFEISGKAIDRLSAAKVVAGDFIMRRRGDRVGLILFGSQAYLQTPLTFDTKTVKELLDESAVGLAGTETAIGDAIAMAVKHLEGSKKNSRIFILLTDGINNAGELSLDRAAELAEHANLKVYAVGIGSDKVSVNTPFGMRQMALAQTIDEKALKAVAEKTGGKYYRAHNTKELANIYKEIDRLEMVEQEAKTYRVTDEIYFWPLAASLLCICFLMISELKTRDR